MQNQIVGFAYFFVYVKDLLKNYRTEMDKMHKNIVAKL